MAVKATPDGYHAVTPYLVVKGAAGALDYYRRVFGAVELLRMDGPDGRVGHAEIRIGDSPVMLADEAPEVDARSPESYGGAAVSLLIYVEDVDATFRRALAAGGKELRPIKDQFYGDRSGTLRDPHGHVWTIATHKEDVAPDEMRRRAEAALRSMPAA
jgi:PhnB protein